LEEAMQMIVIGVDVHKQPLTAVAVDEAGRMLDERTAAVTQHELVAWADGLGGERLWAIEDCRQLTRSLERQLIAAGEQLVRVPPKLMGTRAAHRERAWQVGPDRRARRRESRSARAAAEPAAFGRAALP
jgi:hypothetical protein